MLSNSQLFAVESQRRHHCVLRLYRQIPRNDITMSQVVPVMQQPQAVVMAQPMVVGQPVAMQDPVMMMNGVYIQQVFEAAELCGCEMPNRYKVFQLGPDGKSAVGEPVYYLQERQKGCGSFIYKQCLGPCRSLKINVHQGYAPLSTNVSHEIEKTCGVSTCMCCHSETTLSGGGQEPVAIEDKDSACCLMPLCCGGTKIAAHGMQIQGGCIGAGMCPCYNYPMTVTGSNGGEGSLTKVAAGCMEMLTGMNKYAVIFPPEATAEQRMTLIATAIHVDLNYFEKKKNNN